MGLGGAPALAVLDVRRETFAEEALTPALTHPAANAANANMLRGCPRELSPRSMFGSNVFCMATFAM